MKIIINNNGNENEIMKINGVMYGIGINQRSVMAIISIIIMAKYQRNEIININNQPA
jgi:hypothetical protein